MPDVAWAILVVVGFVLLVWAALRTKTPIVPPPVPPPNPPPPPGPGIPRFVIVRQTNLTSDAGVSAYINAQQQQIDDHLAPFYGAATVAAGDGSSTDPLDWPIFLLDVSDQQGALAYHSIDDATQRPYGRVFLQTCADAGIPWESACSHELVEMKANPQIAKTAPGPKGRYAFEIGDPVEDVELQIAGITLSDFVLPNWFIAGTTGHVDDQSALTHAFQLTAGGYTQYLDNVTGQWVVVQGPSARKFRK